MGDMKEKGWYPGEEDGCEGWAGPAVTLGFTADAAASTAGSAGAACGGLGSRPRALRGGPVLLALLLLLHLVLASGLLLLMLLVHMLLLLLLLQLHVLLVHLVGGVLAVCRVLLGRGDAHRG